MSKARIAGVGMIPFTKPGRSDDWDVMAEQAIRLALADAGIAYGQVQQAYAGYVYADSTAGQSALYRVGLTGIPIVNVNNNCSTGSTALYLARQMVEAGVADCVLAVGFEQMLPGALGMIFNDRKGTLEMALTRQGQLQAADDNAPFAAQQFGGAGLGYQARYGASDEAFARISVKARRHAANNPLALLREPISLEEVMSSKHLYGPITRFQACPPTCGAAAAILVSPAFAARHGLSASVEIVAQALTTDLPGTFEERGMMSVVGHDMTREAARQVYEAAGVGPDDIQAVELHDCFTPNELISYEALGLTPEGTAEQYICDGLNSYGGKHVTNPSGGLLSKGHPLGATGLAQCYELTHQLRGTAEQRQVDGIRFGLQHNIGLGGACVVTLYGRAD
ncbi:MULTISPECIES: lipid-transfer protein [Sphingobium]|uniref:propanoyl-CoA C-acyltransferase n=1 Tax=Sphingobium fuliginis (strain ATCC 27551) TaxID=336203 RepID=A0ABQ1F3A9_SPHSA|nr:MULTISPECIES: lipid-transfer protein [Sphingobium]RYL96840.1 lipid-transfer protein [Sphingobium fuliginis]WDA35929.1 lipid-transfer protein [Sphingobium sp. YC-XJ3]GFZ98061.1 lipid-transfer protein [Sphingobium fuliginis]